MELNRRVGRLEEAETISGAGLHGRSYLRAFRRPLSGLDDWVHPPRRIPARLARPYLVPISEVAEDDDFVRELKAVHQEFKAYMARPDTYGKLRKESPLKKPIAYFSAEFGFHESVPNYSGGLGILSGELEQLSESVAHFSARSAPSSYPPGPAGSERAMPTCTWCSLW